MICSIDICYFLQIQNQWEAFDQFCQRLFALPIFFFPYNEHTEGIFEFRRTSSLEMQMRSITRDVCALNLSKTWFQAGFGFLSPGDGLQHETMTTRQASILAMRHVMFLSLDRFWCENGGSRAHGSGHFGNLTIFVTWPRFVCRTEQCGFGWWISDWFFTFHLECKKERIIALLIIFAF